MEYISHSQLNTQEFAHEFSKTLKSGDIIAFIGGMGAGKTAFVQGLATGLQLQGEVCSPTFALVHEYKGKIPLFHFDMYRITDIDDLCSIGFFDYLDGDAIIAIEWSENITYALPPDKTIFVSIEVIGENDRKITITRAGENPQ
ncbi:MAG: tRNA (adenosine(37)-N6)-threonylcarbamoyltransferase complex ATPase subunit type 1 TsaE [Oscillospiraceae bacterium]